TGVHFRVNSTRFQYGRIHHSTTHYFQPTRLLAYITSLSAAQKTAHIHFSTGLSKRKIGGAKAYFSILSKKFFRKIEKHLLHISHAYAFVNIKSFNLMEKTIGTS